METIDLNHLFSPKERTWFNRPVRDRDRIVLIHRKESRA